MMPARSQQEIVDRIYQRSFYDPFGVEALEYVSALDFDHAKHLLGPQVTAEAWTRAIASCGALDTRDKVLGRMESFLPLAWQKANDHQAIIVNRVIRQYVAWAWLTGDDFAGKIDLQVAIGYLFFGKPVLVAIAEHYGWHWRPFDDGRWRLSDDDPGISASAALGRSAT